MKIEIVAIENIAVVSIVIPHKNKSNGIPERTL